MRGLYRMSIVAVAAAAAFAPIPLSAANAGTLTTLYSFTGLDDGGTPVAGLLYEGGTLYGTTEIGGAIDTEPCPDGCGVVFKVDAKKGTESVVYAFAGGADDGAFPEAGLIFHGGLLYGTTVDGGPSTCEEADCGTVFSVNPKTGAETVLYGFADGGQEGEFPIAGLIYSGGMLYGTTVQGGIGDGNVFAVNAKTGAGTSLYSFQGGSDGLFPMAGLTMVKGNLYGTTEGETEDQNFGTLFEVNPTTGAESVIFNFSGLDGAYSLAGLLKYDGALWGTTFAGGSEHDAGEVFKIDLRTGKESVVYSFTGGSDGLEPEAGLIEVGGMLYGTTKSGGTGRCTGDAGCGVIFRIDPATGVEKVLYSFTGGSDQGNPVAGLIYQGGAFYGTTAAEGTNGCGNDEGCGTVFKFKP